LRFLTAGESHGKCITGIIDEYPSGVQIDISFLNNELARRQKGFGRGRRMSVEKDTIEIISGVRKGRSTGSPISFIIENRDWNNWKEIMAIFPRTPIARSGKESEGKESKDRLLNPRPGHADLNGYLKYRLDDIRDVIERSSARETAARVAAGGFAKIILKLLDINVMSYVNQIGRVVLSKDIQANDINKDVLDEIEISEVRCPDRVISQKMKEEIATAIEDGDSLGGKFKVIATGVPPGLGSYSQWDRRIDGKIAQSFMSIPAVKAVEIGDGFKAPDMTGLNFHDEIYYKKSAGFYRKTNRAGGIEGGITNGGPVIVGACMKPIPTTQKGLQTVNIKTKKKDRSLKERSDVCAVPAASVVGEAVLSIEILSSMQEKFGKDSIEEIIENYNNYRAYLKKV
jgi:chorismate synthase